MLKVRNINTFYGEIQALHDVSIDVGRQEIVSIIGENGAGKSTLMRSIMGINRPKSGDIVFDGQNITREKTDKIVEMGIVYAPEGRYIFPELSVQDNLKMGAYCRKYSSHDLQALYDEMYQMFPRLKERCKQKGGTLSGGEQQMLAIARGLMSRPRLIMFDEPSLGLAPIIVSDVFETIQRIRSERGIPIVLVEQNAYKALRISDRGYILENGKITLQGSSDDLINNDQVKKAYLGG